MRKRPGIGAIQKQRVQQERFRDKGTELQENLFEQVLGVLLHCQIWTFDCAIYCLHHQIHR